MSRPVAFSLGPTHCYKLPAVLIDIDPSGRLHRGETHSYHVRPFENSRLDPASLLVNKIDPWHPLRPAIDESDALQRGSFARCVPRSVAMDAGAQCWWDTTPPSIWRS